MGCAPSGDFTKNAKSEVVQDFHARYSLGETLGRGAFAQVRAAIDVSDKCHLAGEKAVKIIDLRDKANLQRTNPLQEEVVHNESSIWFEIGYHPNCVKLHDVYFDAALCYMVMERCSGDLLQHLNRLPANTEREFGRIFRQMLLGVAHVHSCGIVHRDIKPNNFLVGSDGVTLKLCDFGLSMRTSKLRRGITGTAPFMCPEMLKGEFYDSKADIWSLGVLAYSFLFGAFPYTPRKESPKEMKHAIVAGRTPKFEPVGCSKLPMSQFRTEIALAFVKAMLARNPQQRPSALEALNLEYIVATQVGHHALGIDLPSLRHMIKGAKTAGAFELYGPDKTRAVDELLNELQIAKQHGTPTLAIEDLLHPGAKSQCSSSKEVADDSVTYPGAGSHIASTPLNTSEISFGSRCADDAIIHQF